MKSIIHRFLKGVNRRFNPFYSDDPNRIHTLQNARLLKRGETGFISRIKGYLQLLSPKKYADSKALLAVEGQTNTTNFVKGYRYKLEDNINVKDSLTDTSNNQVLADPVFWQEEFTLTTTTTESSNISESIKVFDFFRLNNLPVNTITDVPIGISDTITLGVIPVLNFVESVETNEEFFVPKTEKLKFVESISVKDRQQDKDTTREFFEAVLN